MAERSEQRFRDRVEPPLALATRTGGLLLLAWAVGGWFGSWFELMEVLSNFRVQLAAASGIAVLLFTLMRHRMPAALAIVAFLIHSVYVAPLWLATPDPLPPDATEVARIMQFNMLFLNKDTDRLVDEILAADAEIVALHELTTEAWDDMQVALAPRYPYVIAAPVDLTVPGSSAGGKALLSRTPLRELPIRGFETPPIAAETTINGQRVLAVALHPSPSRTDPLRSQERDMKLRAVSDLIGNYDGPAVVITDLNVTPTSHEYTDFVDALGWDDPRHKVGAEPTWPARRGGGLLGIAIDHVFVSPHFGLHDYELGSGAGSDHRSLVAVVSLAH